MESVLIDFRYTLVSKCGLALSPPFLGDFEAVSRDADTNRVRLSRKLEYSRNMMLIILAALQAAPAEETAFPEQVPGFIQACLADAIDAERVSDTDDSHKYICAGEPAERLWQYVERAKVRSYEQDVSEGRWLSREFPLGGCFKRIKMADGSALIPGLSCTIWIPRPRQGKDSATR